MALDSPSWPAVKQPLSRWARHWPDEPVPALGGKTPREAAQDPEDRIRLEALLREFEYIASVNRSRGVDDFDVSALREELGVL